MPRHTGLPRATNLIVSKGSLLRTLQEVDNDAASRDRVLAMENDFRGRIATHIGSLPTSDAKFSKFNTNPFVLLIHSMKQGYRHISQIEQDILPAKLFSSMETSAGRMVESVILPVYGWEVVPSVMHSADSVLDGKKLEDGHLKLATLKSGPRCLNDEMSKDIADDILQNCAGWAALAEVNEIDFTYGVLYGTKKQSNKKDWHILRNIAEKLPEGAHLDIGPSGNWHCRFRMAGLTVTVTIRIGIDLYQFIAGQDKAFVEICAALIRACIAPSDIQPAAYQFTIVDLPDIISLESIPNNYNVGILQRSQLEWLFFVARHFCDELIATDLTEGL